MPRPSFTCSCEDSGNYFVGSPRCARDVENKETLILKPNQAKNEDDRIGLLIGILGAKRSSRAEAFFLDVAAGLVENRPRLAFS
jgi:hypothetical protein